MNKFTLEMAAEHIPANTVVRKPQGQNTYNLIRELRIYANSGARVVPLNGAIFLVGSKGTGINEILKEKRMCIDFRSLSEMSEWIDEHFPYEGGV
jgi:hypothetical protein